MKLYYYDHCPFCTRARMIFALLNIPFDGKILANDDEATPINLIGKKMLPILVKDDGTAMGESLDIVRYVNSLADKPLDEHIRPELQQLVENMSEYGKYLVLPRSAKVGYEEFATRSAVDYYTKKKTELVGDFAERLTHSDEYIEAMDKDLPTLSKLILSADAANGKAPSFEDIILFPGLRNLTTVKGINWPTGVRAYITSMSRQTGVPLMFDRAI